ncbi:hypothetical protein C8R47DRAFT_1144234 [Mycena vitilis]|nr:hypothetical protein C8R47DRAFT_1144234 [Mycena vitilis]
MPSRTSPSSVLAPSGPSKPWRGAAAAPEPEYDEKMDFYIHDDENNVYDEPRSLDDPRAYTFKPKDSVWIRNNDRWIRGTIFPASVPKINNGDNLTYWNVRYQDDFGHKLRKYFSPLLGDLKPDTAAVRKLLQEAHWL